MRVTEGLCVLVGAAVLAGAVAGTAAAESFRQAGTEFDAMRPVSVPPGKAAPVVVTEFFHHGEIRPDGRNVLVAARNREVVPTRVLQLGPGDFCRLAFQTVAGQSEYEVYYGGQPPTEPLPPWSNRDGLLLETRHWKDCDLGSLDSLRAAFESAEPFGADYVPAVEHSTNPFSLKVEPFLSRYSGYLHLSENATYGFLTASQDASFLLVDDKLVVAAPGRHAPLRWATRGTRKDVGLTAGMHKFEYYHAAAGPSAIMVAAWEINPPDVKPQPKAIPPEVFRAESIVRLPAGRPTTRAARLVPDYVVQIVGDVPLPDEPAPLVGVSLRNNSVPALTMGARVKWDFGDGQTGDKLDVDHVYLRPGLYKITLSLARGAAEPVEMSNRVYIDRPFSTAKDKQHTLDDYLPVLKTYNPRTLDAASLRQLVLAFLAKSDALTAEAEEQVEQARQEQEDPNRRPRAGDAAAAALAGQAKRDEARHYVELAAAAGKAAFLEQSAASGDRELLELARVVAPLVRDRLGDSETAFQIWKGAAERVGSGDAKADCELEAADVAINDLVDAAAAKGLVDAAGRHLSNRRNGPLAARLRRVSGDLLALGNQGEAARKAYNEAETIQGATRPFAERIAWRGARARSAEEFLAEGQPERAAAEIRQWLGEFPTARLEGYVTLMYARYWAARAKYPQAIAQAEQLQAVGADSPWIDQLLLLAAECEVKRGRTDRALATLHSLVSDYPGSPLVPQAKQAIAKLEAGGGGSR